MSWTSELYQVYETQCGREFDDGILLMPVSHSTANAQIEVTLNKDGTFSRARALSKEEGKNTVIPVTEDSANRTSGVSPMPLADKLIYLAGDYSEYAEVKKADNTEYYQSYIKQLGRWHESKYTHPAVNAVYLYLAEKKLMRDLLESHVLLLDEETGRLLEKYKIGGIEQKDAFVRFRINGIEEPQTWKNLSLYNAFIAWNSSQAGSSELCYATGKVLPTASKHPSKIRNSGDKAKLISANDENGFTYRGRFVNSSEALAVSYDFSQKMHNALKWLIQRQAISFDSLTIVVWASMLEPIPDICKPAFDEGDDEIFSDNEPAVPDTRKLYRDILRNRIFGERKEMSVNAKVMLMGVDSATTGRLSIVLYTELERSRFMENLFKWHEETSAIRYNSKQNCNYINSFSVYDILNCAFGTENSNGWLECKKELLRDNILRLFPCITEARPLPIDIMKALYHKASNPLAYEYSNNYRKVLETACGMIRKHYIDRKEGITTMAYDPEITDRSYLYGCLLAVADAAERNSYEKEDKNSRVTNARRYWSAFSSRPCSTWKIIENRLRPYMDKLGNRSVKYEKMLNEIMAKFSMNDFIDDSVLSPAYLLGYHHYTNKIYLDKEEEVSC